MIYNYFHPICPKLKPYPSPNYKKINSLIDFIQIPVMENVIF